jgi:hypothetical protein
MVDVLDCFPEELQDVDRVALGVGGTDEVIVTGLLQENREGGSQRMCTREEIEYGGAWWPGSLCTQQICRRRPD